MAVDFKISILYSIVVVLLGQCAFSRNTEKTLLIATFKHCLTYNPVNVLSVGRYGNN